MIYQIYVCYNRKVECYERPLFKLEEPNEFVEQVHRDFKVSDDVAKARLAEMSIYHIGTYDDNTGKIEFIEKNMILDVGSLVEKAA